MVDARISVAMCTHNGEKYVAQQVRSILHQRPTPMELVVGDDASTDNTIATIESAYESACRANTSLATELRIIRRPTALGVTANFAATMGECRGELIALSDQDDAWLPGKLATLVAAFDAEPDVLLVHSDARLVDASGADLGPTLLHALEATPAELRALTDGDALNALLRRNLVTGCTVMIRRSLLTRALPFPAEWVHDEWLAAFAAAIGTVRLVPEPLIDYRQHATNQIGARRPTLAHRFARLREPQGLRSARLAERAAILADRARAIGVAPHVQQRLDGKARHETRRAGFPRVRIARVPGVLAAAITGDYGRYSRGVVDITRDLLAPAGPAVVEGAEAPRHRDAP